MTIVKLITPAESDTYNADSAEWLALTDDEKNVYIFNASLYMQTKWYCADVDWEDPTTLVDDQKRACAYYAEADRKGLLYAPVAEPVAVGGNVIEQSEAIGSLKETTKWSGGRYYTNPLSSIDSLMSVYCTSSSATLRRN